MKKNIKSLLILVVIAFASLFLLLYNFTSDYREKRASEKAASTKTQVKKLSEADKLIKELQLSCKNKISGNFYEELARKDNINSLIKVMLYTESKPDNKQVLNLVNAGATINIKETWVEPSGSVQTGHFLAEIPIKNLEDLCELTFIKLISSGETKSSPN
jgi:hypothetical protein